MSKSLGFFSFLKHSIPASIWAIGLSSLLINLATSAIFSGSALYLKVVLGATVSAIGFIEAIVEAMSYGVRIFSGVVSDYFKKRKLFMVIGFVMLTISKPMFAFSKSIAEIFVAKTIDRIGNGLQATPRDALITDSSPKEIRGSCFGLRQSLAVIGSTLGGLFGIAVMAVSNNDFKLLFILAAVPAAIASIILCLFAKEKKSAEHANPQRRKIRMRDLKLLGKKFWVLTIVVVVFSLGRFSGIFITLHACENFGLDLLYGTAITTTYNLFSTLVSYPIGKLSDRMDRVTLLLIGFGFLILSHLSIGLANGLFWVFFGTAFWGIQRGITDGLLSTLVSDYVPKELRGTGFGIYYLVVSASTAVANAFAGIVSQQSGKGAEFIAGAIFCIFATFLLLIVKKNLSPKASVLK